MQSLGVTSLTITTTHRRSLPVAAVAPQPPPLLRPRKIYHPMPPEKVEVFKSLESWASKNILPNLKPVEKSWQPAEFLPDPNRPDSEFLNEVRALRDRTKELPDEYFVALVGDLINEETLPNFQSTMTSLDAVRGDTGLNQTPWVTWLQGWSAEENRHGDLLKTYLYLSGRVDMLMLERSIQYMSRNGMDTGWDYNPYIAFVYTSFQERTAYVSHGNTARLAKEGGDPVLARVCGTIASDEKRHENTYLKVVEKLLEVDPSETMIAIGNMMRKKVIMPANLMEDGRDPYLFEHYSYVVDRTGVFNTNDYVDILEFLIGRWRLEKLEGLSDDARREQEFVCNLGPRMIRMKERAEKATKSYKRLKFSWIFDKEIYI